MATIDPVAPIVSIKRQVLTTPPYTGPSCLVDDPVYLVDDPNVLVGNRITQVPVMRVSASSNAPKGSITQRR